MSAKLLSVIFILLLIASNDYFLNKSVFFHIFGFVLVVFMYYWYRKLVLFQCKIVDFEETNMMPPETRMNQLCRLPVIWSERLPYNNSLFLEACKTGDTALVKSLINSGVNIHETNIFGEGAIFLVTFNLLENSDRKNASCIWTLHKAGCSINMPNMDGFTPLHLAAFKGNCPLINWLLKKGADCDVEPSPAGLALVKGHKKAAALILAHQYKISIRN